MTLVFSAYSVRSSGCINYRESYVTDVGKKTAVMDPAGVISEKMLQRDLSLEVPKMKPTLSGVSPACKENVSDGNEFVTARTHGPVFASKKVTV